jgi:hypothetical protein
LWLLSVAKSTERVPIEGIYDVEAQQDLLNAAEVKKMQPLIAEACARVHAGKHDVNRDNEFFMKSRRERRGG